MEQIPNDIFINYFLSRFRNPKQPCSYIDGYLSRSDGNRLARVNKYYRNMIWQKMGSDKTCWGSWRSASAPFIIDPNECILMFYKKQWKRKDKGISTISGKEFMTYIKNLWTMHPETRSKHPAAFPLELPNRCIKLLSYKDDVICDCFLGSGTTGESAVRLERKFIGIEKSKDYFNMAKERIDAAELQTSLISSIMPNMPIDVKDEECW